MNRDKNGRFAKKVVNKVEGLPEKWCINRRNYPEVQKWFTKNSEVPQDNNYKEIYQGWYTHYPRINSILGHTDTHIHNGYAEITIEQFRKYVLKQEDEFPEKWYIKLSSREISNAVNSIHLWTHGDLVWEDNDTYKEGCIDYDGNYYGKSRRSELDVKGYTEITFEQFKKHVMKEKEKEFVLPENWYVLWRNPKDTAVCSKFYKTSWVYYEGSGCSSDRSNSNYWSYCDKPQPGYIQITWEQFEKHVLKQEEFVLPEKWCIKKNCQEVADWCKKKNPKDDYTVNGRSDSYAHSELKGGCLLEDTPRPGYTEITLEQFKKYVLKQEEKKMYTLKELFNPEILIFLESRVQHDLLRNAIADMVTREHYLCDWNDAYCYSIDEHGYSSSSTKTDKGAFSGGRTIITFDQINFNKKETMEKKIIAYKLIRPEYHDAALSIAKAPSWQATRASNAHLDAGSLAENYLRAAGVLDTWFTPVYENDFPDVKIRGYKAILDGDYVKFGCQLYPKKEILEFVRILDQSGLTLKEHDADVRLVAEYFRRK